MSWLKTIETNLKAALPGFFPTNEQAAAHQAITDLGSALATFGLAAEAIAENILTDGVKTYLGPNAAKIEYDVLHALVLKANARLAALAQPAPALIAPAVPAPVAPEAAPVA